MSDILSIIGISSLVAAIVTTILGLFRDIIVDRFKFKIEKESKYIQKQLDVYFKLYYILLRTKYTISKPSIIPSIDKEVTEFNTLLNKYSSLLDRHILKNWLEFIKLTNELIQLEEKKRERKYKELIEIRDKLEQSIKVIVNNKLIPKYRKIVGETVPLL